jgi:hypothetical protein
MAPTSVWRFLTASLLSAAIWSSLAGCSSLPPRAFAGREPRFEPDKFFTGRTESWGVFENRAGDPQRRFRTFAQGHREGAVVVLSQEFQYDDGSSQHRLWHIRRLDEHHYEGTATDVVGVARGEAYGNAFQWDYTVALKPGNFLFNVHLHQWMYLQGNGHEMVNRATISKFGVEIAQVTESFRHLPP